MSGLSTKNVKSSGTPKTVEPGNRVLKIQSVELQRFSFMEEDNGYFLVLNVESAPIKENFEGFYIDPDDKEKGRYAGQVGQIKTNRFYYRDGQTKSGIPVSRDMDILRQIKNICLATDTVAWFDEADEKHPTIEEFVEAFNKSGVFKEKYINFCVGGKEFRQKNQYIGYDLFLPKMERSQLVMEAVGAKPSKLMLFDQSKHIIRLEEDGTPVDNFSATPEAGEENIPLGTADDLSKAPDFEL